MKFIKVLFFVGTLIFSSMTLAMKTYKLPKQLNKSLKAQNTKSVNKKVSKSYNKPKNYQNHLESQKIQESVDQERKIASEIEDLEKNNSVTELPMWNINIEEY